MAIPHETPRPSSGAGPGPGGPSLVEAPARRRRRRRRREPVGGSDRQFGPTLADAQGRRAAVIQPVPRVLSDNGITSWGELNRRLEAATKAHRRHFGNDPSPGFAFDLVRLPLADHEYDSLLRGAARPRFLRPAVAELLPALERTSRFEDVLERFEGGAGPRSSGVQQLRAGGDPGRHDPIFGAVRNPELMGTFGEEAADSSRLALTQIVDNFKSIPGGIVMTAKVLYGDARAALPYTRGGPTFEGSRELGSTAISGMWEILSNPAEHPGDVMVLGMALLPTPYATPARVTAAAKLIARGSVKGAGKALVTRPAPRTYPLGRDGQRAEVLLAESALMRALQVHMPVVGLAAKARILERRTGPQGTGGYRAWPRALRWVTENAERTYIRNMRKTVMANIAVELGPMRELQRLAKWDTEAAVLIGDLEAKMGWLKNRGLKDRLAVEKAIQIIATDEKFDPVGVHRRFHETIIDALDNDERWVRGASRESHVGQLAAVNLAEQYLRGLKNDPKARRQFSELYEAVATMMERQQHLKMIEFGLDPVRADHRIAAVGGILRFEVSPRDLRADLPRSVKQAAVEYEQVAARIERLEEKLNREKAQIDQRWADLVDTDYDFEPIRRRLTEDEAKARVAELDPKVNEIYGLITDMVEAELGFSGKMMGKEVSVKAWQQSARNRRGSKRARAGRRTMNELVNKAFNRRLKELMSLESRKPEIVAVQSILREHSELVRIIESRDPQRRAAAEFLGEEFEELAFPETGLGQRPHTVARGDVDEELVRSTRARIRYLEKQKKQGKAPDGVDAELTVLRRDLALYTRPLRDRMRHELDAMYGRLDTLEARIARGTPSRPTLERVVTDPLERADYARGFRPFYWPTVRVVDDPSTGGASIDVRSGASKYGIRRVNDLLAELTHEFTGEVLRIGDFRVDTTGFTAVAYRRVVRAVAMRDLHEGMWAMGLQTSRPMKGFMPVRDSKNVPDHLKRFVAEIDNGSLRASVADSISESALDDMQGWLFPGVWDEKGKRYVLPADVDPGSVRWVDERFVLDKGRNRDFYDRLDKYAGAGMTVFNEPFRLLNLFLRPAYALNMLSAAGTALLHEGFLMPTTLGRAVHMGHRYGADAAGRADDLAGQGRAWSYVTESTPLSALSDVLGRGWAVITDRYFRRAALLHELKRQGFRTRDEVRYALGLEGDLNPADVAKVAQASRRAKRVMIDFELRPFEKALLRHIFFVYAFQSRSVLWTAHAVLDHPTALGVLGQLAQLSEDELDEALGANQVEWLERTGYVYAGQDEQGRPLVQNWNQLSPIATIVDLVNPLRGLVAETRYQAVEELFGGAWGFAVRFATGKDEYGRPLEGGVIPGAARAVFGETSLGAMIERRFGDDQDEELPPTAITDRESWVARHNAARELPVFGYPDELWGDPWLQGGVAKRSVNVMAEQARYWNDKPWRERLDHELKLLMQGLRAQGQLLGRKVPQEVRIAVRIAFRVAEQKAHWGDENGVPPGGYEEIRIWVGAAQNEGVFTKDDAAEILAEAKKSRDDPARVKAVLEMVKARVSVSTKLPDWDEDVRTVANTMREMAQAVDALSAEGLGRFPGAAKADEKTRRAYALRYLQWLEEKDRWRERGSELVSSDWYVHDAEHSAWLAEGDRKVTINGVDFPSFQRMAHAQDTENERARTRKFALVDSFGTPKSWKYLTALEKEMLGRKVDTKVMAGWAELARLKRTWLERNPTKAYMPSDMERELVRRLDRDRRFTGLAVDYVFSEQLVVRRFMGTSVYQHSQHRAGWDRVLGDALKFERVLMSGEVPKTFLRNKWKEWVELNRATWLADAGFRGEVEELGPNFLGALLDY